MLPMKKLRRVEVGPHCTFYFETYETMLFQVQEMLLIEKGGEAQLKDELARRSLTVCGGTVFAGRIQRRPGDRVL